MITQPKLRVFTEASGSLTAGYLLGAIKEAGAICIGSDINDDCIGRFIADEFILMPRVVEENSWQQTLQLVAEAGIEVVIPSLDETLHLWALNKERLKHLGISVIISEFETIKTCQDKWLTYNFFIENDIPTPTTSCLQEFPLVKPRFGRGGAGIFIPDGPINMEGYISQEIVEGIEYTIDVFCNRESLPIYIIPRKRLGVKDGKSTAGIVVDHPKIYRLVKKICERMRFIGPVNFQCFEEFDGKIKFVEINPRVAGGMALGFAASENWINLAIHNIVRGNEILPLPIKYGLKMKRYYAEIFVP